MTEEYYEKHQMEEDLGIEVEPPTEDELVEMNRNRKRSWWCCEADFGFHEKGCINSKQEIE